MPKDFESAPPEKTLLVQNLFVKHSSLIKGFILEIFPDFNAVDDILQEVFLVVTQKAGAFEEGTSFVSWARSIARLKVMEWRREKRSSVPVFSPEVIESICAAMPADHVTELDEARTFALRTCIEGLAPQAQRVVRLRYKEAHTPSEIAEIMSWSPDSVYVALSRVRALLRECVERKLACDGEVS